MADDIEVHAVDERGEHITRIIPGTPPATDHTLIPTAELEQLRHELAQLRLIARVNGGLHRSAHEDAEKAETELERMTTAARLANGHALEAEATITRVREFADQITKGSRTVSREFIAQGLLRIVNEEPT